jgi:tetratricopeptide (TPR) repeat protein
LSLLLVVGCRHPLPPALSGHKSGAATPATAGLAQAHAHYMAGVIAELNQSPAEALDQFTQAALADPGDTDLVLEVAQRLLEGKKPQPAVELLTRATNQRHAGGDLYARLGLAYAQLGRTNEAIAACRTALKKSPGTPEAYQTLFLIYASAKNPGEAHKVLDLALKQPDLPAEFLVTLSEMYIGLGRQLPDRRVEFRGEALKAITRAQQLAPSDPNLMLKLADGFNFLGEPAQASPIYLDLLKRYPDSPVVRTQVRAKLIELYLRGKDPAGAMQQLEAAAHDNPSNPQTWFLLGSLASEQKQMDRAADYFGKAILFNPGFEQAYYDLAMAQIQINAPTNALATLRQARAKFGENFITEFLSGLACGAQTNDTEALRHLTSAEVIARATDKGRLNEYLFFQIGVTCERLGNIDQATSYLEKCLEVAPDFTEALNYLGYLWADRGENLTRARELLEKAVKLEPKNPAFLDSLAWALFKLGKLPEALSCQQQAVALIEKPDATLFDHLGDIYEALKEPAKARAAWQQAHDLDPKNPKLEKKLEPAPAP